jgi:hypothetical protein
VSVAEVAQLPDGFAFDAASLDTVGLVGQEDIAELAPAITVGGSALLTAVELVYQRTLAARIAEAGATQLAYERIPAPVVNALMESLHRDPED